MREEIRRYDKILGVVTHLRGWQFSLNKFQDVGTSSQYYLMQLFPEENRLQIRGFSKHDLDAAEAAYLEAEETALAKKVVSDSVLVSVDSLRSLQRAYPNYYSDTTRFIEAIQRAKGSALSG